MFRSPPSGNGFVERVKAPSGFEPLQQSARAAVQSALELAPDFVTRAAVEFVTPVLSPDGERER